jgi:hypothetical protein
MITTLGTYDPAATAEVDRLYRYPLIFREDLLVRVTSVGPDQYDSVAGQMAHCEILSGGYDTPEDIARGVVQAKEMDTRSWSLIPVPIEPDHSDQAATVQGLDPMHDRLTTENIPHQVRNTGGLTMIVQVFLPEGGWLHIERGDEWTGDDNPDDWTIMRFDATGENFDDLGFHLTMDNAVAMVHDIYRRCSGDV